MEMWVGGRGLGLQGGVRLRARWRVWKVCNVWVV